MPFPNEHSCDIRDSADFEADSFRRQSREHEGKSYDAVLGRLKGEDTMTESSYRYPIGSWTESEARTHCQHHDGKRFEPATNDSPGSRSQSFGIQLPHLAARIFDRPLLISRSKLDTILSILGPRLGLDVAVLPSIESALLEAERTEKGFDRLGPHVAVIPVHGTLVNRSMALDALSGMTSYPRIQKAFATALDDSAIHHIVFDIDSPGGEAGVFDLSDTIFEARGEKPITAVMNDSGFSAAYAIASAADRIVLPRMGGVGSIGVIATHIDQSGKDAKNGLRYEHIYAGRHKADFDPHSTLSDNARDTLQAEVDRAYGVFVETVARNRGLSTQAVRDTQARIYFGETAVNAGLADSVEPSTAAFSGIVQQTQGKLMNTEKPKTLDAVEIIKRCADAGIPEIAADCIGMTEEQLTARIEQAGEIRDLCAAAHCEKDAIAYIKANTPVEALRLALAHTRADPEIDAHILPGATMTPDSGWERAFSKVSKLN